MYRPVGSSNQQRKEMFETGRTGKSAYRTTRCLSRNPPDVPVLHVKVCYATCVAVSFSLSSCLDRISQQSHKSAPTGIRIICLKTIIGCGHVEPAPTNGRGILSKCIITRVHSSPSV